MIKAGIVGCGYIAGEGDLVAKRPQIFTHAKAIAHTEGIKLIACCDIDKDVAQDFADKWNVHGVYTDLEQMLEMELVDILVIASPTEFHQKHLSIGIKSKVQAIFCEKPISDNYDFALELEQQVQKHKKTVAINFMRRWDSFYIECKEVLDSGELGRIDSIVAYVDTALYMNSIHMLDMVIYFGGDVLSCSGKIDRINKAREVHGKLDYGGYAFLQHKNGIISFIKASGESRKNNYFEIDIQCTKGRIRMLSDGEKYEVYKFKKIEHRPWLSSLALDRSVENIKRNERLVDAYKDIINSMSSDIETQSSITNALKSMEIIKMIYRSDFENNKQINSYIGVDNEQ